MTVKLENKQMTCWRCGGAGTIAKGTTQCPACSGTGEQARLRPAGYLAATREIFGETASTGHPQADEDGFTWVRNVRLTVTDDRGQVLYDGPPEHRPGYVPSTFAPRADQPCSSCGGSGYRMVTVRLPDGRYETRTDPCTGCGGSGRVG